ncbi:hypothetical protein COCCADRAFT_23651 [Bipolaris zeicola 26-R-13]|uniref:Uncharacterized protein n=1 Tax=Cochliobolus carbonum (strain 26-R-13) TaxID=930089 RepID=W6YLG2_COCC2|nr:uncharacterized protein COCCADRAFT_23651 [Bipolaris zeicola 26-R-13]EUC36524.1 hypothetical protein COCCADRAFT_23651 [Bipolaris zeicola 26-R-13]
MSQMHMYAMYICMHAQCTEKSQVSRSGGREGLDWQTQTASNAARGAEWTAAEIPDGAHAGGDGGGGVTTGPRLIGRCAGPGRGTSWLGKLLANESRRGREALDDEVWKLVLVGLSAQYLQASERASASEKTFASVDCARQSVVVVVVSRGRERGGPASTPHLFSQACTPIRDIIHCHGTWSSYRGYCAITWSSRLSLSVRCSAA